MVNKMVGDFVITAPKERIIMSLEYLVHGGNADSVL
ncbi:Uncharacterised protein [Yersinia enterocolitica]|nr:Uncharacterised protein [Yersinia enterocolitica]CQQ84281.1 Uncharacterised protein [Yersinia enterocolitica]